MSSSNLNPHTPPNTPRCEKRTPNDILSAERRFALPKGQFAGRDRSSRTTYFGMKKDLDHGSTSVFAHTPPPSRPTSQKLSTRCNLVPEYNQILPASDHYADEPRPPFQNLDLRPTLLQSRNHTSEQPLLSPPSPTKRFPDVSDPSIVTTKARSIETAFKIHPKLELDVVFVDGKVCVGVRFEFLKKDLMGIDIMVERSKWIAKGSENKSSGIAAERTTR